MSDETTGSQLSWQYKWKITDAEAEAISRVVTAIAPMIKNLCLSVGVPTVAVGTLLAVSSVAIKDGCDKNNFLHNCEEAWNAIQIASQLADEKLTTIETGQA